jgi:FkbH-like protein
MKAEIRPVRKSDFSRVAQLCQRTNQFNLTSRRYTESDLALFLDDPGVKMFLLQAEDRFGPMGQSGLIIFRQAGDAVEVDTFLMSCRIIGRKFDHALFCQGLNLLGPAWSFKEIRASFIPTAKNSIVAGLWRDYGLSPVSSVNGESFACAVPDLKVSFPQIIQLAENL